MVLEPKKNVEMEEKKDAVQEDKRTKLQKWVAGLSEKRWLAAQIVVGIVVGAAVCFFLVGATGDNGQSIYGVYALVLALFVPRILENTFGRSINNGRIAMLITIVILVVARMVELVATGRFFQS